VDVAILGAGYTGLSAARELAKYGASVVVFEREEIGWGASSRNGGQVLTGLKLDPATLVARYGESRARRLFDMARDAIASLESLIAEEQIDCEYARCGHVQAAWKAAHFDAFRNQQALLARVFDHRVELVGKSDQRREIGTDAYHGVMVDERSGGLHPAKYVRGLALAAVRAGASLQTRTEVTRIQRVGDRWSIKTPKGDLIARELMIATNGYTGDATPDLRRRLIPIGSYIIVTEPLGSARASAILPRRRMAFDSKNFLYYFRLTADDRLLFGGRAEFSAPTAERTRHAADILRRGMNTIFPELTSVKIDYAWGGNVAFTRDELPHGGRIGDAYFAAGYCGHGIAMATALGAAVARRLAGTPGSSPLLDGPPPWIPFYTGSPWFLPLIGAYYTALDVVS
jgi:glycine/D-amino acid oxidase-like deaminating enzyme